MGVPALRATHFDLHSYDHYLVGFSGGKDCLAATLWLLEQGVSPSQIELHHHDVDGEGPVFMDWPCTLSYCEAVGRALGIRVYRSYREGGFLREMLRDNAPTAAVVFETPDGHSRRVGGVSDKLGTRLKFPQLSASLRTRWCSGSTKVDVFDALICNQDRFLGKRTLVITGERAEESANRAHYAPFEPHRKDTRHGTRRRRLVDHWRPVHGWSEAEVWAIIRKHGIVPHVAYGLGWSRLSCRGCIFLSANGVRTLRDVFPEAFEEIAAREDSFSVTIKRDASWRELAARGRPYAAALQRQDLVAQARSRDWYLPIVVSPEKWELPAGAFGEGGGPS